MFEQDANKLLGEHLQRKVANMHGTLDADIARVERELQKANKYRGYKMIRVMRADSCPNHGISEVSEAHELLDTVIMEELKTKQGQQVDPQHGGVHYLDIVKKVKVAYLIFGLARDKAFEELQHTLTEREKQLAEVEGNALKAVGELEDAEKRCKSFQDDYEKSTKALTAAQTAMTKAQASERRMETDIAKIRREIGEARYKEIVGFE